MEFFDSVNTALTDGMTINVGMDYVQLTWFAIFLFLAIFLAIVSGGLLLKAMGAK